MAAKRVDHVGIRAVYALAGVVLIGLGAAILQLGGVGLDPYTAMNVGISDRIGWSLGAYQLVSNLVLFIPVLIWGRSYIGVGTIINMVLTGFFIELFAGLLEPLFPPEPTIPVMVVAFVVGILVFDFGASAYTSAGVGTAPYDAIAPMIVERTKHSYTGVRMRQDILVVAIALLLRGPVGIGTVMTAFFNGPLIGFFSRRVNEPVVARLTGDARASHAAGEPRADGAAASAGPDGTTGATGANGAADLDDAGERGHERGPERPA